MREKLYLAYTDLIRSDFASVEPILAEYKALCEIPADANEAPEEKVRRLDESERRQRLYLYLLARGREGQGRLGEAFDHYISLANMGEAKNLLEMPDEPNVRMRPDVWARGRIEAMIRRSTDAAARKSLEDRVNKEWEQVKSGNDFKRLREFVAVFGPHFNSGAEAQFLLSDKLIETNNDSDIREAQTHLAQLRATADEPSIRARATEALARLMVKNQYMEDAVALYLQLGKEFGTVVVRDGRTGSDFMTNLLTDKRLLPYLEPSRFPMPSRMKVEDRREQVNNIFYGQFEVDPQGDLFPMYRRLRYVFDQNYSGNGMWTIRIYDRTTGVERIKFPPIAQPTIGINANTSWSKFVHANGQMLLVQLGTWVHCYDLAEKKELWQKNLLGDNVAVAPNRGGIPPQELGPDGEITVRLDEGYIITLGKATVLQAGYAALLTRDGLEVVEPLTRRVLWTRRDIKERTQIFGDARYIVLVETDSSRKPVAARVLRAVDGMPVEGSGDSGRVLANSRSFNIIGRNVLLTEGTGEQPRVLRLFDLGTGKDIWRKEYDSKAIPIKSHNHDWTGYVKANGEAEIIDIRSGKTLATLKIDEKNLEADLKPSNQAQLLSDSDRYYLILDRDAAAGSTNGTTRMGYNNYGLRTQQVNGALYAFDKTSNKRLWCYGHGLFENQLLVIDQFAELPVILAAGPVQVRNNNNFQNAYPVVVIEKARGRLLFDRQLVWDGQYFMNLTVNHKNGTIDLTKPTGRIMISPDDSATVAGQ